VFVCSVDYSTDGATFQFSTKNSISSALILTPAARWLGARVGAFDIPLERKVHKKPIPRTGGLAIAASLFLAIFISKLIFSEALEGLCWNTLRSYCVAGGVLIFAVGFFDDLKRLSPQIKFAFQVLAASLAFYGGVRIETIFYVEVGSLYFGILSWAITVLWFVLFINAINLIDGLDGLAAGIAFFVAAVMVAVTLINGDRLTAVKFAILAGVLLGFLRYNFNPASIFMGDGGSYFIGYVIAALAIMESIKTQVGIVILIPFVALGIPLIDTIIAPVRRFFRGMPLFQPDKEHVHHRLLRKGLQSKNAVIVIYAITCALCAFALVLTLIHDNKMIALLLISLTVVTAVGIRKLGYLEYFTFDKFYGWFRDVIDGKASQSEHMNFINMRAEIETAENINFLWDNICEVLEFLRFDAGELRVTESKKTKDKTPPNPAQILSWQKQNTVQSKMMRIEVPVSVGNPVNVRLALFKNVTDEDIQPFTLRRVEYLRRSVKTALTKIYSSKKL